MPIKKNINQAETTVSLAHRLAAYSRQAKQYRNTSGTNLFSILPLPNWKKTTLAALIPLAAASAAQAQCQGSGGNAALGPNQTFVVDVDGDAVNDLRIKVGPVVTYGYAASWFVTAINPAFYIGLSSQGRARGANDGQMVTRGQAFGGGQKFLCQNFGFGQFCLSSNNKSICVRKGDAVTGQPGWVRLSISSAFGAYIFSVTDRGIESLTNSSLNSAVINDCSSLAVAPLPVEMTRFDAEPKEKQIILTWATANEIHNSGFEIQRGTDGRNFSKIGWVNGAGTTATGKEYTFTDNEVQPNTLYYYRLRQFDHNGTEHITPVRSATIKDNSRLTVAQMFPNPVQQGQSVNFQANAPQEGELDVQIFDARGSLVKQLKQAVAAGANTFSVSVGDMVAGIHFVKMQLGKDVTYQQLVVN